MASYYDRFKKEWLFESPLSTGLLGHDPYHDLVLAIKTNIQSGNVPDNMGNGLYKLEMPSQVTYWLEHDNTVEIIAQFEKKANGLYVELVGKRQGSALHVSDFYEMVLANAGRLIFSGDVLSDQGLGIWKQLFKTGKKLFVYDMSNTNNNKTIDSEQELHQYMNDGKYRFVLSESLKQHSLVTTSFDLLRTYKLTFNLEDKL